MATVYLAHDVKHDRKVAVKVIRPQVAAVIGPARFLAEIKTTANLQHPHIVGLIDSGDVDGVVYYVMPFIDGESLRDRLSREKQLPVADAVRIADDVAGALDYAHRRGVIHRDIKPANILLHDGRALVADFGIALAASPANDRITETGISLGTPAYMSPEQAMGARNIDARTDIYSLGCVLYQMLSGDPPFTGSSPQAIVSKVLTTDPQSLVIARPAAPRHVMAATMTAVSKLPADRFATAAAFGDALRNAQYTAPVRSGAVPAPIPAPAGRRRFASRPLLAVACVWVGGLAGVLVSRIMRTEANGPEPRQWTIALDDSLPMYTSRDPAGTALRSLDIAPNGRTLVYASSSPAGERLVNVNLENDRSSIIRGTNGARSPALSPDGSAVAAVVGDTEVRRFAVADGASIQLVSGRGPTALTWHPNGRIYYNGGCITGPVDGGTTTSLVRQTCHSNWVASENGVISANPGWVLLHMLGVISVASVATGEVRPLTVPIGHDTATTVLRGSSPRFVAPGFLVYLHGSTLLAAPFDPHRLRLTGEPRAVLSNVRREQSGMAQMAISDDGTLVWATGDDGAAARFVWANRTGRVEDTLQFIPPVEVGSFALIDDGRRLAYNAIAADGRTTLMVADLARRVVDPVPFPLRLDPLDWLPHENALTAVMIRPDGSWHPAIVHFGSTTPTVDTTLGSLLTESSDGRFVCHQPSFTDEKQTALILFRSAAPGDSVVYDPSGSGCRFSPDGEFVLWRGSANGLVVAPTGRLSPADRVSVGPRAVEPRWSADGREVVYRSVTGWYSVPAPGPRMNPGGKTRALFHGDFLQAFDSWDCGTDGRFLLLVGRSPVPVTHLNVITDFGRFLAEKLGPAPGQ